MANKDLTAFGWTDYNTAIHWLGNQYIKLDIINELDKNLKLDTYNVLDYRDVCEWYLCNCTHEEMLYLAKNFNIAFAWSKLLCKYILCVNHFGTRWDYVRCPIYHRELAEHIVSIGLDYDTKTRRNH